ncbi:hypothetical protein [Thermococcus sp. JdF3]|uniref:GNAT family N-acetyltransferase n=1 Tax=Thermococcus sp. JdF3 TaxID=1638258 RepID=UPI001F0E9E94|nr:hypothetical protein [Thermococcus sp. JdF3]
MRPVILRGKKVSLAVLLREDLKKSWDWFNDRSTVRYLLNSAHFTLPEQEEEFYGDLKKNWDKAPMFGVVENEEEKPVGVAGFNWINWQAEGARMERREIHRRADLREAQKEPGRMPILGQLAREKILII